LGINGSPAPPNGTLFSDIAIVQETAGGQLSAFANSAVLGDGTSFFVVVQNQGSVATNINGSLYITVQHEIGPTEILAGVFEVPFPMPPSRRVFFRIEIPENQNEALYLKVSSSENGPNLDAPFVIRDDYAVQSNHLRWQTDDIIENGRRAGFEAWLRRQLTPGMWSISALNTADTQIEANFTIYLADAERLGNYFSYTGFLQTHRWTLAAYTTGGEALEKPGFRLLTLTPPESPHLLFMRKTFCPTFATPNDQLIFPVSESRILNDVQHTYVFAAEPNTDYCLGIYNDVEGAPYQITISAFDVSLNDPEAYGNGGGSDGGDGDESSSRGLAIAAIVIFSVFIALIIIVLLGVGGYFFYRRKGAVGAGGGTSYRRMTNEL